MLDINDTKILELIARAIREETFVYLYHMTPKKFKKYPPKTVFVGNDREGRTKTILVTDEIFDWVFNLEIGDENKSLCEMWDLNRLSPTGFEGELIYKNRIGPGVTAGGHYHKKKREEFFVVSPKGKLTFNLTRIADGESVDIQLDSSTVDICGSRYSLALRVDPGIMHSVSNQNKKISVLLIVVADRSHNHNDDYREE